MTDYEWRLIGITMSEGWEHYLHHRPEPHILLFRRQKYYERVPAKKRKTAEILIKTKRNNASKNKLSRNKRKKM